MVNYQGTSDERENNFDESSESMSFVETVDQDGVI